MTSDHRSTSVNVHPPQGSMVDIPIADLLRTAQVRSWVNQAKAVFPDFQAYLEYVGQPIDGEPAEIQSAAVKVVLVGCKTLTVILD